MSDSIHFSKQEALAVVSNLFQYESTSSSFGLDNINPDFDLSGLMTISPISIARKYIYQDPAMKKPTETEDFKQIVKVGVLVKGQQALDYIYRNIEENLYDLQSNHSGRAPEQWIETINGFQVNYTNSIRVLNPFFKLYLRGYEDISELTKNTTVTAISLN
jgi:hypothetical protein